MKLLQLLALAIGGAAGWILAAPARAAMDANPILAGISGAQIAVFAAGVALALVVAWVVGKVRR